MGLAFYLLARTADRAAGNPGCSMEKTEVTLLPRRGGRRIRVAFNHSEIFAFVYIRVSGAMHHPSHIAD